jgi:hydrogenase 3 maturation protease
VRTLSPRSHSFALNFTVKKRLRKILKGKVVIVGVGQVIRSDDGLGALLVNRLKSRVRAVCIEAGSAPENYVGKVIKEDPDTILLIDAVHLDRAPGAWEILEEQDIIKSGFTTHDLSPALLIEYLKNNTKAEIFLLAIQPQNLSLGGGISEAVQKRLDQAEQVLGEILTCTKHI